MNAAAAYDRLAEHSRLTTRITAALNLLSWDQQVMLPPAAHAGRAEQIAALTTIVHRRLTDPAIGDWLAACEAGQRTADPLTPEEANIQAWRRDFDLAVKVPEDLVVALAREASAGQRAWELARQDDDFAAFAPHLATLLALSLEKAAALGYATEPYDALLDAFEPGETASSVAAVLAELRAATVPLVAAAREAAPPPDLPAGPFPVAAQQALAKQVMAALGLPEAASRLDVSAHPFSSLIGPDDARITTRFDQDDWTKALFGVIHETGHALYSLGHANPTHYGTPMGEYVSLGIHESQSRLWENLVGRGLPFWTFFLPEAARHLPALAGVSPTDVFRAVGAIRPGHIRVDADETTYNLHVILRFELELALTRGDLAVADLPEAWNAKSRELLGLSPPTNALGVLQDVHWASGAFGYFPTYALGNVYAACLFTAAGRALPDRDADMAAGRFGGLLAWLRDNVHLKGRLLTPRELVRQATGAPPTAAPCIAHLQAKAAAIYGL